MFVKMPGYLFFLVNLERLDGIQIVEDEKQQDVYNLVLLFKGGKYVLDKSMDIGKLEAIVQQFIDVKAIAVAGEI